ncbi:MAG: pitrilysin family protein [Bacteroidota bacterium]
MVVIDRKNNPQINEIQKAEITRVSETRLKNNIPVYYINAGTQDLVKIELLFPAGIWQQPAPLIASTVSAMLQEGTSKHNAKEIAEEMDYFGAFLETQITHDFSSVAICSLNKHLEKVLPFVEEIISDSLFPQNEWDVYLQNKKQQLVINYKKVNFVAQKEFAKFLFGNNHPYGHSITEDDFDKLDKNVSYDFYKKHYSALDCKIIVSGKVNDNTLKLVEKHFGGLKDGTLNRNSFRIKKNNDADKFLIYKDDAVQSAIRIGKMLFTKTHPDYLGMQVLNTIFGGYFGSRLMANIREDKGYTYGIGSAIVSFSNAGYFTITTEVGTKVTENAIEEIYFELNKIQNKLVPDTELQLVRNYMLGTFLRSIDGPFALANCFKGILFHGLNYDYYDRYIETIKTITPKQLQELANKYLKKDEMIELVAGRLTG